MLHALTVVLGLASASPQSSPLPALPNAALILEARIPLGNVRGRIDHLAFDHRRERLYVAELGNDTVGIVDLRAHRLVRHVPGFDEPQGIAYDGSTDSVYVANGGDGSVRILRAGDFAETGRIALGHDADNIRIDHAARVYVGHDAALAIIDASSRALIADIALKGHPEGFQVDALEDRIFVNVPDAHEIAVLDLSGRRQIARWATATLQANYPLALDAATGSVLAVFRRPARLERFDSHTGRKLDGTDVCGDSDDVFFDESRRRVYVICGQGAVETFDVRNAGFTHAGRLETPAGSRTGLLVRELDHLVVAVRATPDDPAALWILRPEP
jgi:DNA-binding beta-propeller fold protein YncE